MVKVTGLDRKIKENKRKLCIGIVTLAWLFFTMFLLAGKSIDVSFFGKDDPTKEENFSLETTAGAYEKYVVVIDAGHGGNDPGKSLEGGIYEKDINLDIAKKLKKYLEMQEVCVVMTREEDMNLAGNARKGIKSADMKERAGVIEKSGAAFAISIHQNSYPAEEVYGAQAFYYAKSAQGKRVAEKIQNILKDKVDSANKRAAKGNDSYYLLKESKCPCVIVECGFLSNIKEGELLQSEEYKERMAYALSIAIMQYLHTEKPRNN